MGRSLSRAGLWIAGLVLLITGPGGVRALETYPTQPIRIVVPIAPGSAPDFLARIAAAALQRRWGQPVLVDNRPGGAQNIGGEIVARAAPDGYTLLAAPPASIATNKFLYPHLGYDPDKFEAVTVMAYVPNLLLVRDGLPVTSLAEFVQLAKGARQGLTYGGMGAGSTFDLTAEAVKAQLGAQFVNVPFKGAGQIVSELLAGRLDFAFMDLLDAWPHVSSGRLRALAIGTEKPDPNFPDLPTMNQVWPGLVSIAWYAVVAPAGTPLAIREQLAEAIRAAFTEPDAAKRLADLHATPVLNGPAEARAMVRDDGLRWGEVIRNAGLKGD